MACWGWLAACHLLRRCYVFPPFLPFALPRCLSGILKHSLPKHASALWCVLVWREEIFAIPLGTVNKTENDQSSRVRLHPRHQIGSKGLNIFIYGKKKQTGEANGCCIFDTDEHTLLHS